jgi:hypothetical protein
MPDTDTPPGPAERPSDDGPRPDAGRLITRLQGIVGEQTGQLLQYEDLIEQLQEQVTTLTAELARAKLPAERTPPAAR